MKLSILLLLALFVVTGCDPNPPSEHTAYRLACDALANDPSLSASTPQPAPIEDTGLYLAKNAGCVILPYEYTDEKGETVSASYTVWLKRVERRWTTEKAYVTPTYPVETTTP